MEAPLYVQELATVEKIQTQNTDRVLVAVRVRPLSEKELKNGAEGCVECSQPSTVVIRKKAQPNAVLRSQQEQLNEYVFDQVFGPEANQSDVYTNAAAKHISSLLNGINVTVIAYGATGAGKTHTMMGSTRDNTICDQPPEGIIPMALQDVFSGIEDAKVTQGTSGGAGHIGSTWSVKISYCEVYNENVYDLLSPSTPPVGLRVLEDATQGAVIVQGLSEINTPNPQEVLKLLISGNENRTTESTAANAVSSRSHAILWVIVREEWRDEVTGGLRRRESKLSLIDLAGSERASATLNAGARLQEGAKINRSLLALANCINKLALQDIQTEKKEKESQKKSSVVRRGSTGSSTGSVVNYRDSKLTHLLKSSLEGHCRMIMIANINPNGAFYEDSHNTLKYANRAKEIKVQAEARETVGGIMEAKSKPKAKDLTLAPTQTAKANTEVQTTCGKKKVKEPKRFPMWVTGKPKKEAPQIKQSEKMQISRDEQGPGLESKALSEPKRLEEEIKQLRAKLVDQEKAFSDYREHLTSQPSAIDKGDSNEYFAPLANDVIGQTVASGLEVEEEVEANDTYPLALNNNDPYQDEPPEYIAPSAELVVTEMAPELVPTQKRSIEPSEELPSEHKRMRESEYSFNESYETLPMPPPSRLAPPPPPPPNPVSSPIRHELTDEALQAALSVAMGQYDVEHERKLMAVQSEMNFLKKCDSDHRSEIVSLKAQMKELETQNLELKQNISENAQMHALELKETEDRAEKAENDLKSLKTTLQQIAGQQVTTVQSVVTVAPNALQGTATPSSFQETKAVSTGKKYVTRKGLSDVTNSSNLSTTKSLKKTSSTSKSSNIKFDLSGNDSPQSLHSKFEKVPACALSSSSSTKNSATHAFLKSKRWTRSSAKTIDDSDFAKVSKRVKATR